jgi:glycosyltransferase involved in cell wall biosynthesis
MVNSILHAIFSKEFGGSERYAADLAGRQAEAGHRVAVIIRAQTPQLLARWRAEAAPAELIVLPSWWPKPLWSWALRRLVAGFVPDVIHTHLGQASRLVGALPRPKTPPLWRQVATLHLAYRAKDYAKAEGLIALTHAQAAQIPSTYTGQITTIWNWLPRPFAAKFAHMQPSRPKTPGQPFTFLSVGRLVPQKGMDVLIQAFKTAFPADAKVRLHLVGWGPEEAALRTLMNHDARITLDTTQLADQTGLMQAYASADAYVSAARYEPFGLTIVEAMQCALPLVCTRTQGPSEFLQGCKNVVWAECGSVPSLVAALQAQHAQGARREAHAMTQLDGASAVPGINSFYAKLLTP